jgi:hypothetical protein
LGLFEIQRRKKMDMRLKRRNICAALAGIALISASQELRATIVDLPAVQDATLLGGGDATSNASLADPGIFVGTDGASNPKRGLVEFNIAANVPAGATITNVQLDLTAGQTAGSGGNTIVPLTNPVTISLFDEAQSWGQPTNVAGSTNFGGTGHGGAPQTGDVTWNDRFFSATTPTAWTTAGGDWTSNSTDIADASGTGSPALITWSSTAMVSDVQNWLDNSSANNGWLLKNSNESASRTFIAFWSAQGAAADNNSSIAPELIVTYTPVPEPTAVLLLAGALPMLLKRRRRRNGKEQIV